MLHTWAIATAVGSDPEISSLTMDESLACLPSPSLRAKTEQVHLQTYL